MSRSNALVCAALLWTAAAPVMAQDVPLAFVNATIYPVTGEPVSDGVLIIRDGKIRAVGSMQDVAIPRNATQIDATDRIIIPGLVDTHSHVGIYGRPSVAANADGNERTDPRTPQIRAQDAIWPADPGIRMATAGGVTTANIMPGSGNVIGGQTAYVKLRGETIDEMLIPGAIGGLKMANGENPKRNYGSRDKTPQTRMAVAALARQAYLDAQNYVEKRSASRRKSDEDLAL